MGAKWIRSACASSGLHIAPTREQAFKNIEFGFKKWQTYFNSINPAGTLQPEMQTPEALVEQGVIVIGTPDDAIAQIKRVQAKQGEFGCFLQLAHNWADFEATKRSYEMWMRYVQPAVTGANAAREEAFNWARDNKERFIGAAMGAAMQTIAKHHEEQAKKSAAAE